MSEVLTLPGRGNTYFYFTRIGGDGFSDRQQSLIRELIRIYRLRYPELEINGVWDFGMEEGSPYAGEKYGDFAACRDHAVFNNATLSISFNHIRVSRMPGDLSAEELDRILKGHSLAGRISASALEIRDRLMNRGTPPPQIREAVREDAFRILEEEDVPLSFFRQQSGSFRQQSGHFKQKPGKDAGLPDAKEEKPGSRNPLCPTEEMEGQEEEKDRITDWRSVIEPGPHNGLELEDPLFADVWAIRQLEESMNLRRLTVHELGHALADVYELRKDKRVKKLFSSCRDGFENLDEFCAECFMASELTDAIPLANRYAEVLAEKSKVPARAGSSV